MYAPLRLCPLPFHLSVLPIAANLVSFLIIISNRYFILFFFSSISFLKLFIIYVICETKSIIINLLFQSQNARTGGLLSSTGLFAMPSFPNPMLQQQPGKQLPGQQQSQSQQLGQSQHQQPLTPSQQHLNNFQQSPRIPSVGNSHLDQASPIISQPPSIEGMPNGMPMPSQSPTIANTPTSTSPTNSTHHQPPSVLSNVNSTGYCSKVNTPNSSGQVATVSTTIKRVSERLCL